MTAGQPIPADGSLLKKVEKYREKKEANNDECTGDVSTRSSEKRVIPPLDHGGEWSPVTPKGGTCKTVIGLAGQLTTRPDNLCQSSNRGTGRIFCISLQSPSAVFSCFRQSPFAVSSVGTFTDRTFRILLTVWTGHSDIMFLVAMSNAG